MFEELGLQLHYTKTEILVFTSLPKKLRRDLYWIVESLQIGPDKVGIENIIKYLGVMLDDRLDFRLHIEYIAKKLSLIHISEPTRPY